MNDSFGIESYEVFIRRPQASVGMAVHFGEQGLVWNVEAMAWEVEGCSGEIGPQTGGYLHRCLKAEDSPPARCYNPV